jgi:hypothetical protein
LKSRVAISRFNGNRRSERGQVARDPMESTFGVSGNRERLHRGFANPRSPEATWQRGAPETSGIQVAQSRGIGTSGLGV